MQNEEPKSETMNHAVLPEPMFSEPDKALILIGKPQDKAIFDAVKSYHIAKTRDRQPIVWELTTADIRARLPKKFRAMQNITIRRGLKRLQSLGLIKLHNLGYNRVGYSITRWDLE